MKLFPFFIAMLILLLAVQPCCAGDEACDEIKAEQTENRHSEQDCGNELPCSPFYSCGSCLGFSIQKQHIEQLASFITPKFTHSTFWLQHSSEAYTNRLIKPPGNSKV